MSRRRSYETEAGGDESPAAPQVLDQQLVGRLPSAAGGSSACPGSRLTDALLGVCVWAAAVAAGGGVYLKALRLLTTWWPTSVLRPKARQSTTVMLSGGWRCSFSGSS